ncbi:MAG: hypothetical protein WCK29_01105 [archaeon]
MPTKPYSASLIGNNFKLVEEKVDGGTYYYLVGLIRANTEYFVDDNPSPGSASTVFKVPLTIGAYEAFKDGLERIPGSGIDVLGNLEIRFISP